MPNAALKYRADIDGLRGIAVLSVVAFHAFPEWISGGFVGVDVFFVISGFLISGIIFKSLDNGGFSFRDFYARRIRRIFPALILVLSTCYLFGSATLDPYTFNELARHVAGGAGFLSNFILWHESGYFARAAETKPLLHLWSLGIEEQFYIFWPAFAYLVWKQKRSILPLTIALALLSFLFSVVETDLDPIAAFYSPLTRLWELLLGGATALLMHSGGKPASASGFQSKTGPPGWISVQFASSGRCAPDLLALAGALLIAAAVVSLRKESPFPGWLALFPTIGTSLLLLAGSQGAWVSRNVLAHRLLVGVGLISYPLYLWHWPILWVTRYFAMPLAQEQMRILAVAISILLAWLTYVLLERPIRSLPKTSAKTTGLAFSMAIVALVSGRSYIEAPSGSSIAGSTYFSNVAQLRWIDNDASCIKLLSLTDEANSGGVFCHMADVTKPPNVAILGDSTAEHLYPGMRALYSSLGQTVINLGMGTCAPFNNLYGSLSWNKQCHIANRKIYDYVVASRSITTVILGIAPWDIRNMQFDGVNPHSSLPERFAAMAAIVDVDLRELRNAGKTVVVTFDAPHIGVDPRTCLNGNWTSTLATGCTVPSAVVQRRMAPYVSYWRDIFAKHPEVCVFSQDRLFLAENSYRVTKNGLLLFRDDHHLSFYGSEYVAQAFASTSCFQKPSRTD
jgi:peptidoglycan/LPS O-acetylase OafA/YrhL